MKINKIRIGIDIDLVCTRDLGEVWWYYLIDMFYDCQTDKQYYQFIEDYENNIAQYDLTKYFNLPYYVDPMSFWKQDDLYDDEDLVEGCYDVVKGLWQCGFEIVFISHTTFEHIHSKYRFLQRNFDFLYENDELYFIATKSKFCTDGAFDIVIDDRNEHLQYCTEALRIKMETPYLQNFPLNKPHHVCNNWQDVEDVICDWIEEKL